MSTLLNKTALVTGASRGIGRATALALAQAGTRILVHYGRSTQDAESLVATILSQGGRADAIRADLGTAEGAILLAKEVGSIVGDRLDVLVLNAGISKAARILDERRGMRKYLAAVNHLCFTPVAAQCTTFDGVIIAASMSSCAAKRSSLMLWA